MCPCAGSQVTLRSFSLNTWATPGHVSPGWTRLVWASRLRSFAVGQAIHPSLYPLLLFLYLFSPFPLPFFSFPLSSSLPLFFPSSLLLSLSLFLFCFLFPFLSFPFPPLPTPSSIIFPIPLSFPFPCFLFLPLSFFFFISISSFMFSFFLFLFLFSPPIYIFSFSFSISFFFLHSPFIFCLLSLSSLLLFSSLLSFLCLSLFPSSFHLSSLFPSLFPSFLHACPHTPQYPPLEDYSCPQPTSARRQRAENGGAPAGARSLAREGAAPQKRRAAPAAQSSGPATPAGRGADHVQAPALPSHLSGSEALCSRGRCPPRPARAAAAPASLSPPSWSRRTRDGHQRRGAERPDGRCMWARSGSDRRDRLREEETWRRGTRSEVWVEAEGSRQQKPQRLLPPLPQVLWPRLRGGLRPLRPRSRVQQRRERPEPRGAPPGSGSWLWVLLLGPCLEI